MQDFAYIIGPLPFCVPLGEEGQTGSGTAFPLEQAALDDLCRWVWRVRTWRCEITGLANEFASYEDYSFDFANHEKTGTSPPGSVLDVIAGHGLNVEHRFTVLDSFAQPNEYRLRILGLDAARRKEAPGRYFPFFNIELDLLLPGNLPPEEIALRSLAGSTVAGTLGVDSVSTDLYTGFPGQLATAWQGNLLFTPIEEWSFDG